MLLNIAYCEGNSVTHIIFNNIECIFRKSGIYSYLIFCESDKLNNYVSIIDQLKEEILSWTDEEDDLFIMGKDFMRFRFRTDNNLVSNENINIPVCVISLSCVVKRGNIYYPLFKLKDCFYENNN